MIYQYFCEACLKLQEIEQDFLTYQPLTRCPLCDKIKLRRIYSGENFCIIKGDPTTVRQLGEANWNKLGRYKQDALLQEREEKKEKARAELERNLPKGAKLPKKEAAKLPWWRDGSIPGTKRRTKPLDVSKIKDIKRYVATGNES